MRGESKILLNEEALASWSTEAIVARFGISMGRTVRRHCALLCLAAAEAIGGSALNAEEGGRAGLYCAIPDPPPDSQLVALIQAGTEPAYKILRKNASPMSLLSEMPVVVAGWVSKVSGIRGPVRIFNGREFGLEQALEQAELDLDSGAVERALVVQALCRPLFDREEASSYWL